MNRPLTPRPDLAAPSAEGSLSGGLPRTGDWPPRDRWFSLLSGVLPVRNGNGERRNGPCEHRDSARPIQRSESLGPPQ